ncbi:peroxiredoxin [Aphanomyces cochlioides]|nr:peroxiredoxin [Aphanomyces cochlioides]
MIGRFFGAIALLACVFVAGSAAEINPVPRPSGSSFAPSWNYWSRPLSPRKPAPDFTNVNAVVDEKFTKISLNDYKGKWLVIFFYPFDFTFVCPTEIISFSDSIEQFRAINAEVIAVSTDSHHTHLAWIKTSRDKGGLGNMDIPILADISKQISANYGVLVNDPSDDMFGAALRGLFIIDPQGIVRSIQINDDQVGRSVDETLRILKAFQYAMSHPGEVCPANWKPGSKTIKADQEAKYDFFDAAYGKH